MGSFLLSLSLFLFPSGVAFLSLLCAIKVDIMHLIVWPYSKDSHNEIRINYLCGQEMKQKKAITNAAALVVKEA